MMAKTDREHLFSCITAEMRVVDIGGGANPYPRADYVIDGLDYNQRGSLRPVPISEERVSQSTWTQLDICARSPWPFPDNFFDFALCTHVLEDLRDPIWVCHEMSRIARAGYIEVPSRILEQSRGVEHPCYAGYYHHRWLISLVDNKLIFRQKPHSLHVIPEAIVANLGPNSIINHKYANLGIEWQETIECAEALCFSEHDVNRELCEYAETVRRLDSLVVPMKRPLMDAIRRWLYYSRLRRQARV